MDLETLKNQYAQEQGYPNWKELRHWRGISEVADGYMNEICIRAQKAALEKAGNNAYITCKKGEDYDCKQCYGGGCENPIVERESITNEQNLIR